MKRRDSILQNYYMSKLPKYQGKKGSSEIKPRRASFTSLPGMGMLSVIGREAQRQGLTNQYDIRNTMLNPKNWFPNDYSKLPTFDKAYQAARQQGEKEFIWKGKRYSGEYAGSPEEQLRQTGITNEQLQNKSFVDEKLHRNLNPVGYGSIPRMLNRLGEAVIYNEPSRTREMSDQYAKKGRPDKQRRLDAWYLYQGYPQRFNTFSISKNKPSASENNNASYYSINNPKIQNELLNLIKIKPKEDVLVFPDAPLEEYKKEAFDRDAVNNIMGRYKLGLGKDDKGKYISYYDNWDLAPISQNVNMDYFGKPFEIYDRIYYKDENGKAIPIDPNEAYRKQAFQDLLDAGAKQAGAGSMNSTPVIKLQKTTQFVPKKQSGGWLDEYTESSLPKYQGLRGSGQITSSNLLNLLATEQSERNNRALYNMTSLGARQANPNVQIQPYQPTEKYKKAVASLPKKTQQGPSIQAQDMSREAVRLREEVRAQKRREEAIQNSALAQSFGSLTPGGYNPGVGAIGAETFINMNPITGPGMSASRLTEQVLGYNPYGFGQSNALATLGLLGDIAGVGMYKMLPGSSGVRNIPRQIITTIDRQVSPIGRQLRQIEQQGKIAGLSDWEISRNQLQDVGITSNQRKGYTPLLSEFAQRYITPYGYSGFGNETKLTQTLRNIFGSKKNSGTTGNFNLDKANTVSKSRSDAWRLYLGMPQKHGTFRMAETSPVAHTALEYAPSKLKGVDIYSINTEEGLRGISPESYLRNKDHFLSPRNLAEYSETITDPIVIETGHEIMGGYNKRLNKYGLEYNDIWDLDPPVTMTAFLPSKLKNSYGFLYDNPVTSNIFMKKVGDGSFVPRKFKIPVSKILGKPFMSHGVLPYEFGTHKSLLKDRLLTKINQLSNDPVDMTPIINNYKALLEKINQVPERKKGGPLVNSNGYKDGKPPKGSNWRIPGNTVYNPTGETILAQANTGEQTILQPYDTNSVTFQDADYIDEYHLTDSQPNWLEDYKAKLGGPYNSSWMLTNPKPEPVYVPKMQQAGTVDTLTRILTPLVKKPKPKFKQKLVTRFQKFEDLDVNIPNIEFTDVRPAIAQPTFEQARMDMSKPTKYSFTYPTFDKDVQKTMYFPNRNSWKTFVEQQRGASSQEGKDYGSATGQFAMGGNLLSKSVTCPNCGHSWKGADGGTDALTCHKCGSVVKMQNGGWLREYQDAGPIMGDEFAPYSRNYLNNFRNEWIATYNKPIPYRIPRDDRFDEFYHEKVNTIPQYYKTIPAWVKGLGTDMEEYREGDKNIPPKSMGKLAKGYEWVENYRTGPFRDDSQIREYARLIRSIRNAESRKPIWNRDVKFKSE